MDGKSEGGRRDEVLGDGASPTLETPLSAGPGSRGSGELSSARFFADASAHDPTPEQIGPYRIIRELGRGGMGTVYLAVREDDRFRRQVALKVIKRGMDTEEILRRFHLERQVLSALTHPNIARLLDGGAVADGRPYFVLEYIEGQTIDAFCDANGLNVEQRLRLFQKVCSAVHYAHQNLIVHRDLKPHNILVTLEGEPKLLDFGIAKLINTQLMQVTMATGPQMHLMTPEYASPEQVRGAPVSTASDVYSLGALLYELLTGHRPYKFESRVEQEIVRVVCEVDPERPSSAVSRIEELHTSDGGTRRVTPETVARVRESDPTRLRRSLSGDLDDIVMKAMEKAPPRRYLSAQQLAEDLQRHIDGMPIQAGASRGAVYKARKFVRRNRGLVSAAAAVLLALLAGLAATTWQWRLAEAARDRARTAAAAAQEVVEGVSRSVQQVDGLIAASDGRDSGPARFEDTLARLDEMHRSVEAQEPEVRSALRRGLVSVAMLLGDRAGGARGPSERDTAAALLAYETADAMFQRAPDGGPDGLRQAFSLALRLGDARRYGGDPVGAEAAYAAAAIAARALSAQDGGVQAARQLSAAERSAAVAAMQSGRADDALVTLERLALSREDTARREQTAQSRRDWAVALSTLAECQQMLGMTDEAVASFEKCIEVRRGLVAEPPVDRHERDLVVAQTRGLADLRLRRNEPELALALIAEAKPTLVRLAEAGGDARSATDLIEADLLAARAARDLGRIDDARRWADEAGAELSRARQQWPDSPGFVRQDAAALLLRGDLESAAGAPSEAVAWYRRAVAAYRDIAAQAPSEVDERNLGAALWKLGAAEFAAANQVEGEARRRRLAAAHGAFVESLNRHSDLARDGRLPATSAALDELPKLIAQCEQAMGN